MDETTSSDAAQTDSGCTVDWSWLVGREVASAASNLDTLELTFADGQTLKVQALLWKGQAFLSFAPWKAVE
jgi:hypothetical protein